MDPVTLYPPFGGQPYTTDSPTEHVRLIAQGYSTEPVFNPAEHKADEVREYLAAHPEDAPRVVAVESKTKARKSVIGETEANSGDSVSD